MPYADSDGVKLWFNERGAGRTVIFLHELASDLGQWAAQAEALSDRFRCVSVNARGYPPSEVPQTDEAYTWERQVSDIGAMMDHLGVAKAALVGCSMGAYAALQFARLHPERVGGVCAAGVGSGSPPLDRADFQAQMLAQAELWEKSGPQAVAELLTEGPNRKGLQRNNPSAWRQLTGGLYRRSRPGMARTCRNFQARRPPLEDYAEDFATLDVPVLLAVGEQDAPCLETTRWLAGTLPRARLWVVPDVGHSVNLEDPEGFNTVLGAFLG